MKLVIVRHGETEGNRTEISQGHTTPLNSTGVLQAQKLAQRLKHDHFDIIFVSNLTRTKQTADEILKFHPHTPVVYEPRLRERDNGVFDGTPYGTMRAAAEQAGIPYVEYKPEKGESVRELQQRVHAFMDDLSEKYHSKSVLLITHGGPMVNILLHVLQIPEEKYEQYLPQENTVVTILEMNTNKKYMLKTLNCAAHLK